MSLNIEKGQIWQNKKGLRFEVTIPKLTTYDVDPVPLVAIQFIPSNQSEPRPDPVAMRMTAFKDSMTLEE